MYKFAPLRPTSLWLAASMTFTAQFVSADTLSPQDYIQFDPQQAQLGRLLFYDKALSGNQNISCGTCHHHDLAGTDGLSLGIGEGGMGLGQDRTPGSGATRINARIPRNAPALWNLGAKEIRTLFHDGRVERIDHKSARFKTPAGQQLPLGLNSILAAQALFPMSSDAEMAGTPDENPIGHAFEKSFSDGWDAVTERIKSVPDYTALFKHAFPHVNNTQDITITEIANALAAFIGTEWQSHDSPYDDYLRNGTPLPALAETGRKLFFGEAGCVQCHSGPLFSDQDFHALGLPNFGPGRAFEGQDPKTDVGRMEVTGLEDDAYRFRTPSLRNVALTGPYGHNGAYPTLEGMIRHMLTPQDARAQWAPHMAGLPSVPWLDKDDFSLLENSHETARQIAFVDLEDKAGFSDADVQAIEAFLHTLTGKSAENLPMGRPERVPSGLPVD